MAKERPILFKGEEVENGWILEVVYEEDGKSATGEDTVRLRTARLIFNNNDDLVDAMIGMLSENIVTN